MSARDEEPTRGAGVFKSLSRIAIARPLGTCAVTAMVLVIGLFASGRIAVNLLPDVVYPLLRVSVNYPGVAPSVMEEQVTRSCPPISTLQGCVNGILAARRYCRPVFRQVRVPRVRYSTG